MTEKKVSGRARMVLLLSAVLMLVLGIEAVVAHNDSGYLHDSTSGYLNKNWMAFLPDETKLSQMSIPGTHDTMAFKMQDTLDCLKDLKHSEMTTQSMDLKTQLESGIRVLDIRVKHVGDPGERRFKLHHGKCFLLSWFGTDVLEVINDFLDENDTETVIMRLKEEQTDSDDFNDTFEWYMKENGRRVWGWETDENGDLVWTDPGENPTLGEIRGKIVILDNFAGGDYGIHYCPTDDEKEEDCNDRPMKIQDEFKWSDAWGLYGKWEKVKDHLYNAPLGNQEDIYLNYLSATAGAVAHPYFFASGHTTNGTGDSRAPTGFWTPLYDDKYPDFPRVECWTVCYIFDCTKFCTIAFEGVNTLTKNYLSAVRIFIGAGRMGMLMADFPGPGLISSTIAMNPEISGPLADAGGPYSAQEGSPITFDAGGSLHPEGNAMTYRWDFDGDGIYETPFSDTPTASHTWHDDWIGEAIVEVKSGSYESTDSAEVTVLNVAPTATVSGDTIDEDGVATMSGTIYDPSNLDEFDLTINWGEELPVTYSYPAGTTAFSESHHYLDDNPTGTAVDVYDINVTVVDDNGGEGTAETTVTVNNLNPVTTISSILDETGEPVGSGVRAVLTNTQIDLQASFTDVGTQDLHKALINWHDGVVDDLGPTSGNVSASHSYTVPGDYEALLQVTDEDTGTGAATALITVVDASGAIDLLATQLQSLAAAPNLNPAAADAVDDALAQLWGEDNGAAANGALDELAKGNLNAALVKMWQAMRSLADAETADPSLDLTAQKSLLALAAKSTAMTAIVQAEAVATKSSELRKIADAYDLITAGDNLLALLEYVTAADTYREAAQEVQGQIP